jgi:hypothetical protein
VPPSIEKRAHKAQQLYPYAISLIKNVATYQRICVRVSEKQTRQLLVAIMKKNMQNSILCLSNIAWKSYQIEKSVQKFADAIYYFREKVDDLVAVETSAEKRLKELDDCEYSCGPS